MTEIILGIIIALIVLLALFLIVLFVRQPQAIKVKSDKFSLEELTYSPVFKNIINGLMPPTEEREYRQNERLISDSGVNISMRVFYLFKVVTPVVLLVIFLSIFFINRSIRINAIITDQIVETVDVLGSDSTKQVNTSSNQEKREMENAKKDTYQIVENLLDTRLLKTQDALTAKQVIQEIMLKNHLTTEDNAASDVTNMYDKLKKVDTAKKINPVSIIIILMLSLVGYYIPNLYLIMSRLIRYQSFDNEVIALEMLTIMVGSIENVTVKEILRILSLNSKAFKPNFEKALLEYPIDFEQALINLGDSSKNKDFQALVSTLRQCATSDKYSALQTLQRRRLSRKEYRKLMEEKKIETKMYIAFVMLLPVLFFLAKLLLSPWQDLMSSSGLI